jgi:Glycosyl transferase family 11
MILVRLSGGLGNQLFQYATGRGLAARHRTELVLDTSWYGKQFWQTTSRPYDLYRYPVRARFMTAREARWSGVYTHALLKRLSLPRKWLLYRERRFGFDPEVLRLPDQVFLDGYWQCPRYFDNIATEIRDEATPTVAMDDQDKRIADLAGDGDSIAVHVRRGDYVTLRSAARAHGTCSLAYYRGAIDVVTAQLASPRFFVFSDDPHWTRANLRIDAPVTYVTHNSPDLAFQDLRLMSLCRHQIIANSSLSWWGAWLNPYAAKIVVAPRTWLLTTQETTDLIPEGWIRIESE